MNIKDVLDQHRIPYREAGQHHHVTQGWINLDCPYCSPRSGRYRLGFNLAGGYMSCWVCGFCPPVATLAEILGMPSKGIPALLGGLVSLPRALATPRGKLALPAGLGPLQTVHMDYLKGRGFDPDILTELWELQGTGVSTNGMSWRIFIPIHFHGQVVSWTTRGITDKGSRYHNAKPDQEAMKAKDLLYGIDHCRHSIIICEGPADVWRIGLGAVATMGVVWTQTQLALMLQFPIRAVCFDNEPNAQHRAMKLCQELSVFPGDTSNVILEGKDPAESSEDEIQQLRKEFLGE